MSWRPGHARVRAAAVAGLLGSLAALAADPAGAAGLRGELRWTASHIDYRTVVRDTLPSDSASGDGLTRILPDGTVVTCLPGGDCYWYRAGEERSAHPMTQDLKLTGWPGWTGVQARAHIRGRLGSDDFWPRSTERLEIVALNVDWERGDLTLRGGRQATMNGLGAYDFDGGRVSWRPTQRWSVAAYGGLSLGRTLLQSHTGSLLSEADDLAPDRRSVLLGLDGRYEFSRSLSAAGAYQRELRTDRVGLYSERAALDARWYQNRRSAEFSGRFDLATAQFNLARLHCATPLGARLDAGLELRHSAPFFELWTIWGAFSPVGFNEARGTVRWQAGSGLMLDGGVGWRDYQEPHVGTLLAPIEGDGLRFQVGASGRRNAWQYDARVSVNRGFGAYRSALDVTIGRKLDDRLEIQLLGQGTQQFAEFRFGDGRTLGAGARARYGAGRVKADGQLALYRHSFDNRPGYPDDTQLRGQFSLTVGFGTEPVSRNRRATGDVSTAAPSSGQVPPAPQGGSR